MSTLGAASSGLWEAGRGVPSLEDMADEGVAGGGGEELEEGPDGYLNFELLLPEGLLLELAAAPFSAVCEGDMGGIMVGGVVLVLWLLGLFKPNLSR